jgi:hypothetical protein
MVLWMQIRLLVLLPGTASAHGREDQIVLVIPSVYLILHLLTILS